MYVRFRLNILRDTGLSTFFIKTLYKKKTNVYITVHK